MTSHEITVYFDLICAWSYIGHRNFFEALDIFKKTYPSASQDTFSITFRPFYRDRTLPERGVPLTERLASAFGEQRTEDVLKQVKRTGLRHGIVFSFKGDIGHTRKAHEMVAYAAIVGGADLQRCLVEKIYSRWFEGEGDITSTQFLLKCAESAGMPRADAEAALNLGSFADMVDALDAEAREHGVKAVPTFVINSQTVEGAADTQTFYKALAKAKEN